MDYFIYNILTSTVLLEITSKHKKKKKKKEDDDQCVLFLIIVSTVSNSYSVYTISIYITSLVILLLYNNSFAILLLSYILLNIKISSYTTQQQNRI